MTCVFTRKIKWVESTCNASIWIIWRKNKNSTPVVLWIWITAGDSSLADIHYSLAQATWFGGLNLTRILLKFNDLPTRLTVSELEKQLFSRDFRLSLSKRPKKTLVNTRKGKLYLNMDYPFICFLLMFNNQVSHDHRRLFQASFRNCLNCVQNCDDHGLLDFKSAVQCMKHFIYHFICSINKANE